MKQTIIRNVKINFSEKNLDRPCAVIFLHGNSHSYRTFNSYVHGDHLDNYHLIFIDLPGHGNSGNLDTYSVRIMGEILSEFISKLSLKRYIIVGHSLGGHIALNMLANQTNPEGLFIYGTPPLKNPFDPNAFLPNENSKAMFEPHPTDSEIRQYMMELNYSAETLEAHVVDYKKTDPLVRSTLLNEVLSSDHYHEIELLKSYIGKVMFLLATEDSLINNTYIREECLQHERISLMEVVAGHSPHIDQFEIFTQALIAFCDETFKD